MWCCMVCVIVKATKYHASQWLWEGVAVERGYGRHLKYSYNACKIS